MLKVKNIMISPIRAARSEFEDETLDFILCSSGEIPGVRESENILFLQFLDTEMEDHPFCFREKHAERILAFLSREKANGDLFVCCDSGESRSPAIAAAILRAAGQSDTYIWENVEYHPNCLVYRRLCKAFDADSVRKTE